MKKSDNSNLKAKLDLRRHFLEKYHADGPVDVLDCCQGSGVIWANLRQEFAVDSYFGVDEKPKKGRLRIDSIRLLQLSGWKQNVVDIDTYGSPWRHWLSLLPNVCKPLTVFLTCGQVSPGGSSLAHVSRNALGLGKLDVPNAIACKLNEMAVPYLLAEAMRYKLAVVECVEAVASGNARYIGVRLERA